MPELIIVAVYLLLVSIAAAAITVYDKKIAVANGKLEAQNAKSSHASKTKKGGKASAGRKKNAGKGAKPRMRVPEKTLFLVAALGGSVAMLITMHTIRHKTKHKRFMIGIPAIIVAQCALVVALVIFL